MDKEDSTVVFDKTWDQQNTKERASKKDAFGLSQEPAFYKKYEKDGQTIQPCKATFEFKGKLNSTDEVFGQYNVTLGVRIYNNDTDTKPINIVMDSYQIMFGEPVTDFEELFEEKDVPETKFEVVRYMKEKNKFRLTDFFPNWTGPEKFGFQRLIGGYKLYGTEGTDNRWFFTLKIELPTALFN
jgi:hypothetical protein